ncbi:MAG TPA: DUF2092 domain-containing protein [Candidatus Dormibacteraeota bacterium]|nr:DUF2092 domain-containing protein [Candidatus Dormibacteraeota bacterium]
MKTQLLIVAGLGAAILSAQAQSSANIDPRAERILKQACDYLAQSKSFMATAEVWREHLDDSGQKVQFTRTLQLDVRRPDQLHAEIQSGHTDRAFWFDGKALTSLDRKRNLFSVAPIAGTLDSAIDRARDEFGVDLPLIDLAVSDPYKNAMAKVTRAVYFGPSAAMGFQCHHLAFTQDNVDWQVWIEDGPRPLIRKFVIVHKNDPGSPEFTGLIKEWDFSSRISDADFVFEPPEGAVKIDVLKNTGVPSAPTGGSSQRLYSPKEEH